MIAAAALVALPASSAFSADIVTSGPAAAGSAPPRKLYVGDGKVRIETSDCRGRRDSSIADTV